MSFAQEIEFWEDVARKVQRTVACHRGNPLSGRDSKTHADAIAMACCHLVDLRNRCGFVRSDREIVAWAHNVRSMDVHDLGSMLSDALVVLRNTSSPVSMTWFKQQVGHPELFGKFIAPVSGAFVQFTTAPEAETFAICNQVLSFLTHLTLEDLNLDLEDEYVNLEASLQDVVCPETVLSGMSNIMSEWVKDVRITPDAFRPRHGKGAVAGLTRAATSSEKYRTFGSDALLDYVFSHYAGIDVSSYAPYGLGVLSRVSEVVFVPKSMNKRRTISKEPAFLQFLQQGVRRILYKDIEAHPYLSKHICFRRQDLNGALALLGSEGHRFSTIDLSAASDRVTLDLVKRLFHGTPILPFLVGTRSRTAVLPSGRSVGLRKFAPMGSALCFPIQTLVFACAVEYAVRRSRDLGWGFHPVYRVYGDDIIVEGALYQDVIEILTSLGFIVNEAKSFSSPTRFRESCGMEAYDGTDVTPVRISRRFQAAGGRITFCHSSLYEGLIDLANVCYVKRFSFLRSLVVRKLLANRIAPPLFSAEGRGSLISVWPDNYRAQTRWNWKLQRCEVYVVRTVATQKAGSYTDDDDAGLLFEWLRLAEFRQGDVFEPEHRIIVPRGTVRTVLAGKWVQTPFFGVHSR